MNRVIASHLTSLASLAAASAALAQSYSFTLLDSAIPGSTASAVPYSISGNGQVVAGGDTRFEAGEQPFIWRKLGDQWVRSQLPVPPQGTGTPQNRARAMSLSFDGDVIGGMAGVDAVNVTTNYGYPAIWTQVNSGQPTLQVLSTSRGFSAGVRNDGAEMVFSITQPLGSRQVFRWQQGVISVVAPEVVPADPDFAVVSFYAPQALSQDGSLIAMTGFPIGSAIGHVWDAGVVRQLDIRPEINGPFFGSQRRVQALSADGSTIIGFTATGGASNDATRAIRWTRDGRLVTLPWFRPFSTTADLSSFASDLSADGRVIVGSQHGSFPWLANLSQVNSSRAMVWINDSPRPLAITLTQQGVDLGTAIPRIVTGVSDDGTVLTGIASNGPGSFAPLLSFVATILPPGVCDDIDFNRDGIRFDPLDIDAFLSVFSEGPCLPAGANCRDIDFNNDGSLFDPEDIDAFLRVFSEGPCTL